ncbi:1-(5-phosphoribosyl)-5-[(5-phosphoribosylamino)methylideneamino] imidazole-4-carboxamide isomerase [Diplonema papillatum]|nr:1-(5-phosphoribosyl)-5-[(5-phosphoribosylamino)methylideneamino] imidazole-4-carboxamide isomerase [Diplonema papillatum]
MPNTCPLRLLSPAASADDTYYYYYYYLGNFVSKKPAAHYAELYKKDGLTGGHVIMLGKGNDEAAAATLAISSGQVKQIVGATLTDTSQGPKENFVSEKLAAHCAGLYKKGGLTGGHVIMLGKGNDEAAAAALAVSRWAAASRLLPNVTH